MANLDQERAMIARRGPRRDVVLWAHCRTLNGLRDRGQIYDISAHGCCVQTSSLFFRVGTRVIIRPDGLEGLTGIVRWIVGDRAGIEFDKSIYQPVLDHLAHRFARRVQSAELTA